MSCCKDCLDRTPHCHGTCERYLKECEERKAMKESIKKQNIVESYCRTTTLHALEDLARRQLIKNRFEKGHSD